MIRMFLILLQRAIIFAIGVAIAFVAAFKLFPIIDQRLPFMVAILVTYCLIAYIGLPSLVRLIRLIRKPKHIPLYSVTPDGLPCDPINICIVGTEEEVKATMRKAGWTEADKRNPVTLAKMFLAITLKRQYKQAPFSPLYLFGRKQDFGFQIPIGGSPFKRHHVRFWEVGHRPSKDTAAHITFWQALHGNNAPPKQPTLWVAAATYDKGLGVVLHNGQIDHWIDGNTNQERDFVVETLQQTGCVRSVKKLRAGKPYTLKNRVFGATVIADGEIVLVNLRRQNKQHTEG